MREVGVPLQTNLRQLSHLDNLISNGRKPEIVQLMPVPPEHEQGRETLQFLNALRDSKYEGIRFVIHFPTSQYGPTLSDSGRDDINRRTIDFVTGIVADLGMNPITFHSGYVPPDKLLVSRAYLKKIIEYMRQKIEKTGIAGVEFLLENTSVFSLNSLIELNPGMRVQDLKKIPSFYGIVGKYDVRYEDSTEAGLDLLAELGVLHCCDLAHWAVEPAFYANNFKPCDIEYLQYCKAAVESLKSRIRQFHFSDSFLPGGKTASQEYRQKLIRSGLQPSRLIGEHMPLRDWHLNLGDGDFDLISLRNLLLPGVPVILETQPTLDQIKDMEYIRHT